MERVGVGRHEVAGAATPAHQHCHAHSQLHRSADQAAPLRAKQALRMRACSKARRLVDHLNTARSADWLLSVTKSRWRSTSPGRTLHRVPPLINIFFPASSIFSSTCTCSDELERCAVHADATKWRGNLSEQWQRTATPHLGPADSGKVRGCQPRCSCSNHIYIGLLAEFCRTNNQPRAFGCWPNQAAAWAVCAPRHGRSQ